MNFLPGGSEWIIILVIVLIIFGAGKLPQIGGAIGQSIREFREASKDEGKDAKPADKTTEKPVAKAEEPVEEKTA
jgi:sec-independent protein translocase protein TatA